MKTKYIPKGHYCYSGDKYCPYSTNICFYDDGFEIKVPYCLYLKDGSIDGNSLTEEELRRLAKVLGYTEDELIDQDEIFQLDLLWDAVKCCGINF